MFVDNSIIGIPQTIQGKKSEVNLVSTWKLYSTFRIWICHSYIYTIRKYFQDFFWWQKFDNTLLSFGRILHFLNHITDTCKICESCCVFLSVSFPILFLSFYLSIYIRYFIMHKSSFLHSRLIHHSTTSVDVLSVV